MEVRGHLIVPATFLILGISFLMMYINDVREWAYLIPSVILAGVGVVVLLADTEYLSGYEVYDILHTYWPVGLILVGIAIILRRRDRGVPPGFPPGGPTSGGADSVGGDPPASAIPSNPPAA